MPDRAIVNGEFLALLVIVRLPVKFPLVKGVNVVRTAVICLGLTTSPEALPLAVNPGPETETPEIVTLELPVLVNITDCCALLASPVGAKFNLLTLATSGDEDPATGVDEDDRLTLQMLSAPAELITPIVSSTETEPSPVRNATFEPNVTCPELSSTYAL